MSGSNTFTRAPAQTLHRSHKRLHRGCRVFAAKPEPTGPGGREEQPRTGLGLKAAWLGAEQLGNVRALFMQQSQQQSEQSNSTATRLTREEALSAIRQDYAVDYFISGKGQMTAYSENCLYADEFASFTGTERFKRNVSNLGGFLEEVQLEVTDFQEGHDYVQTKWRFNAIVGLPWKPRLAAAGSTRHVFDPDTNLVVQHIESWAVDPATVLRSLLKPSSRVATSRWEVLMASIYSGDIGGIWLGLSQAIIVVTVVALPLGELVHLARGEGLVFGPGEVLALAGLTAAAGTQLYELIRTFSGGQGV